MRADKRAKQGTKQIYRQEQVTDMSYQEGINLIKASAKSLQGKE